MNKMNKSIGILFRAIPLAMAAFCFGYGAFINGYGESGDRIVAGFVVFSLGMICIALFATADIMIRQLTHTDHLFAKYALLGLGYLSATVTLMAGIHIFTHSSTLSAFVAGHIVAGAGLIVACVAIVSTCSTHFFLTPAHSNTSKKNVPKEAFSFRQERVLEGTVTLIALAAWVWAFLLMMNSPIHPVYFAAGHVMAGIACICTSLIALVATIVRQTRNVYTEKERTLWPEFVLLMGTISLVWGIFVIFGDFTSANGVIGYIMVGLGLICYSISGSVFLLAKIWRHEFKLVHYVSFISALTSLACFLLAAFVFELGATYSDYFIPARILTGLGSICFALFSIVSIIENGTSSETAQH